MNDDKESTHEETEDTDEPTSLLGRLFNVFAAPGEMFEELAQSKVTHSNWMVPVLMSFAVGILFSVVVFSQPDMVAGVFAEQEAAVAAKVEAGKMSQEQADQVLQGMRQMQSGKVMMIFGSLGTVIGTTVFLVIVSLLMWILIAKILKGDITLVKTLEMVGLAGMINVLGGLVTMLIVLLMGSLTAGPNAAIFVEPIESTSYLHQFLGALNIMTIWYYVVLCIGASKFSQRSFGTVAVWVFGVWAVVRFGMAFGSAWWAQYQVNMG